MQQNFGVKKISPRNFIHADYQLVTMSIFEIFSQNFLRSDYQRVTRLNADNLMKLYNVLIFSD